MPTERDKGEMCPRANRWVGPTVGTCDEDIGEDSRTETEITHRDRRKVIPF